VYVRGAAAAEPRAQLVEGALHAAQRRQPEAIELAIDPARRAVVDVGEEAIADRCGALARVKAAARAVGVALRVFELLATIDAVGRRIQYWSEGVLVEEGKQLGTSVHDLNFVPRGGVAIGRTS
jgi:hypothetical protein